MLNSFCWLPLWFLLLSGFQNLSAQQIELTKFIEKDSALFVVINSPADLLDQFESSLFFQNRNYQRALSILRDEQFSLTTEGQMLAMEEKWQKLRDSIAKLEEISIIIHSWESGNLPKVSVILVGSPETGDLLEAQLSSAKQLLEPTEDSADEEGVDFFGSLGAIGIDGLEIKRSANFVLLTNARNKAEELIKRVDQSANKKFRSLARNRSYQRVQSQLVKRLENPFIRGYVNPKNFGRELAELVLPGLSGPHPRSFVGAGFQVSLNEGSQSVDSGDITYTPVLEWDLVVAFTMPAKAYGKAIESFQSIEDLPSLPNTIRRLDAEEFDSLVRYKARQEIFGLDSREEHHMEPELEDLIGSVGRFGSSQEDSDIESLAAMSKGSIRALFGNKPGLRDSGLIIEKVNNHEAAKRFLLDAVEVENSGRPESTHMEEVECDFGTLYARSNAAIRELWDDGKANESNDPLDDKILSQFNQYFLNDDWLVIANSLDMKMFLECNFENGKEDNQAFDVILKAAKQAAGFDSSFKVSYRSYQDFLAQESSFEIQRLLDKYPSRERFREAMAKEPDQYGLRIEIESAEDAQAAVMSLFERSFFETFGTTISVSSQENQKMMTFGQIYSARDD